MIQMICTLLMILAVIYCVVKKFHVPSVFFAVSWIALILWALITGNSVLGETTTGNVVLDVFEFTYNTIKTQLTGTVLTCAAVFGYVGFMNKIGASDAFTTVLAKPLAKIKQPYILLGCVIVITAFLKLVIPSAASLVALLFAILFPIFVTLGCSNVSIASAFILGTCITWGPADAGVAISATQAGIEDVSTFFLDYQFIPCVAGMIVMAIVFVIISIFSDKKLENAKVELSDEQKKKQEESMKVKVPTYYCIMPLFPLILILLFSGKILPITLSTVAVVLIAIAIADIIHVVTNRKNYKAAINDANAALMELGGFVGRIGFLIIGGSLFAGAIGKVGGMSLFIEWLNGMGGGAVLLGGLGVILGIVIVACTGSYTANLNIFGPFMATVASVTGSNAGALAQLGNMACGLGTGLTPVSGTMLFISGETKVAFPKILMRNLVPILAAAVTEFIVIVVFYL